MYRRAGRGRLLLIAFLVASIVVITLDFRQGPNGALERVKDISGAVVAPLQRGFTAVTRPVGDFFSSIADLGRLRSENERLKAELEEVESQVSGALSLEERYERLLELNELQEPWVTMDRVTAEVIASTPANYNWVVTIDSGTDDGVHADMTVVNADGLVGKIVRARADESIVRLLIDPQTGVRARIKEADEAGTIAGHGGEEDLSLQYVDPSAEVEIGQDVITAGYDGGIFPPSIPIGEVVSVSTEGGALDQDIEVRPWVDFDSLDYVFVLLESGPRLDLSERKDGAR
jgi:rod shape-determining protein MreC